MMVARVPSTDSTRW